LLVTKKDGSERSIEDATGKLKTIQKILNTYLQATFYTVKTKAAYGYVANARDNKDIRTYITGALKHQGNPYLLNIDLKDFFHFVTEKQVKHIFQHYPFLFPEVAVTMLTKLICYNGRLPMGTHTSPAMSNFALRQMDLDLLNIANRFYWQLTRYADDISFSSKEPITAAHFKMIQSIIRKRKFEINEEKTKWFEPDDEKVVTGIIVNIDSLDLPTAFIDGLRQDVKRLQEIIEIQNKAGSIRTVWVDKFKQVIRGKINYLMNVKGRDDEIYKEVVNDFKAATRPPADEFGVMSWRFFPY
jgi:RNA-directed DNA polymerase